MKKNKEEPMPETLEQLRRLCVFCNRSIIGFCGTWTAYTSGCCVGAEWKGTKWLLRRGSHIYCFNKWSRNKFRGMPKLMLSEEQTKKKVVEYEKWNKARIKYEQKRGKQK